MHKLAKELIQTLIPKDKRANKLSSRWCFAPSNIALCKYWGKRDTVYNLPTASSLSISLANKGTMTRIQLTDKPRDEIRLNQNVIPVEYSFYQRIVTFLDAFRLPNTSFFVETQSNIPVAAGLASSASGFAALVLALDDLFNWTLPNKTLSILARMGSGSACRSLWSGFVLWHMGQDNQGLDSFAEPLPYRWDALNIGLLMISKAEKPIGSTKAMLTCQKTSPFYSLWPATVTRAIDETMVAIVNKDIEHLGQVIEENALSMHALMQSSSPPIVYHQPETINMMHQVWALRAQGIPVYFTQDAGANLKLLFLEQDKKCIQSVFQDIKLIKPFSVNQAENRYIDSLEEVLLHG